MSTTAEHFALDLREIQRTPLPSLDTPIDLTRLLMSLTSVFLHNSVFHFAKLFLGEGTAQLATSLTSDAKVISSTCLSTGRAVVMQIKQKTEVSAF